MTELLIEEVKHAREILSRVARKTNLTHSASLSDKNNIYLKSENLQLTGSFKLRGAYYKIAKLTDEEIVSLEDDYPVRLKLVAHDEIGGTYKVENLDGFKEDVWLCNVVHFLFGEHPEYIFIDIEI